MTSQYCTTCQHRLSNVVRAANPANPVPPPPPSVRGLKFCQNCENLIEGRGWKNRDANAAISIWKLGIYTMQRKEKPAIFRFRSIHQEPQPPDREWEPLVVDDGGDD